jgi:hypothetical protein
MTERAGASAPEQNSLVDGHVHLHPCFRLPELLDCALANFGIAARRLDLAPAGWRGLLLLAETGPRPALAGLAVLAGRWSALPTAEAVSLRLRREDGREILAVAGRQIPTREGLEVLALGTASELPHLQPLPETVAAVRSAGALPVIAWGAGKWTGSRLALLRGFLRCPEGASVLLGDSANRPRLWPLPRGLGGRLLGGSDPLPFAAELWRPGGFGSLVEGAVDAERPWASLAPRLRDPAAPLLTYGRGEGVYRFLRNQALLRLRRLAGAGA